MALLHLRPATLAGVLLIAGVASADDSFRFGGTRAAGMGGAGLALPVDIVQNQRLNPAMLGLGRMTKFGLQYPEVGIRTTGFGIRDLKDTLGNVNDAGVSNDGVIRFARKFGDRRTEAAIDGGLGAVISNLSVSVSGGADVTSIPNDPLRAFVASGRTDYQNAPPDSRLDAYGYGFYQLAAGFGAPVHTASGNLTVGGRLKSVKAYYAHKVADQTSIANGTGVANGAEFGPGSGDTKNKTGLGADLGLLFAPQTLKDVYFGATIDNLIRPNVGFTRTLPNSNVLTEDFNPFVTTTSVGVGSIHKNLLLAGDIFDLFNRGDRRELRLGGELGVGRALAVRAGYNSRTGFTLGASVYGFNFAISGREPLIVSTNIRF